MPSGTLPLAGTRELVGKDDCIMPQNRQKKQAVTLENREPQPVNGQPANGQPPRDLEERILDPLSGASPSPDSGKLSAIADAFLDDDAIELDEEIAITTCTVHRPREHDIFRVHPGTEWRRNALLIEYRGEDPAIGRGPFLIHPQLRGRFGTYGKPHLLLTCITPAGSLFLWPVRVVKGFGDTWYKSALVIAKLAEAHWVRMWSVKGGSGYLTAISKRDHGEPKWRGEHFEELAEIAFADYLVTSLDHPLCRALEIE
jgi:hypothetical protein